MRHAGRRDDQAHRLRHHRADHAGPAGRASRATSPDILIVDNPVVSTLAKAGVLTTTAQNGLSTPATIAPNILGAGVINGKTYGVPIGANTLALYYNKTVLKAAGVDPASITELGHR